MPGRTVKLSDAVLRGLANNKRVRDVFPLFRDIHNALGKRGCRRCNGKTADRQNQTLASARISIANASPESIQQLKRVINVSTIVVHYKLGNGKIDRKVL